MPRRQLDHRDEDRASGDVPVAFDLNDEIDICQVNGPTCHRRVAVNLAPLEDNGVLNSQAGPNVTAELDWESLNGGALSFGDRRRRIMEDPMQAIMPMITSDDLEGVRAFYTEKLGFFEAFAMRNPDGDLNTLSFAAPSGAPLMFGAPMEGGVLNPDGLMLFVSSEDVDAYHAELASREVDIAEGLTDQFWGDRTFIVRDQWGLHLMFGQTVNEMSAPPEGFEVEMAQPVG